MNVYLNNIFNYLDQYKGIFWFLIEKITFFNIYLLEISLSAEKKIKYS